MSADRARDVVDRADRLRADRGTAESVWQEIRDNIVPLASAVNRVETRGGRTHRDVLDNSAETASDMLAAAVVSILTPDHSDWFQLRLVDGDEADDHAGAVWLEQATAIMLSAFRSPRSGFAASEHELAHDIVDFGTGCQFIADRPGAGIRFMTLPLRQVLIDENADGEVDTVFRDFELTARQAVQKWQGRAGGKVIQAAADPKKQDQKFRFVHAVQPRGDRDPSKRDARNMPFTSTYVSVEDKSVITDGGFQELPYVTPRWAKRAEEIYGRGCGHKALADVKSLQRGMKVTFRGAERMIDPPLLVENDGVLGPVKLTGGALNWIDAAAASGNRDPIRPLLSGARPDIGEDLMAGVRFRIDNAYMKPLVQMIRKDRMTATEVLQVAEEGQRVLGPYLGRLKSENLGPKIERVFAILMRAGAFPPPPETLQGREIRVEYVSPAVRQQKVGRARGIAQLGEILAPFIQMDPTLMDNLDADVALRDTADILGLPQTYLRAPEAVQQMRQQRAEAQAQAQQQQQMVEGVDTAANAVRALPALRQAVEGADAAAGA